MGVMELTVEADAADTIELRGDWSLSSNDGTHDIYTNGSLSIKIADAVDTSQVTVVNPEILGLSMPFAAPMAASAVYPEEGLLAGQINDEDADLQAFTPALLEMPEATLEELLEMYYPEETSAGALNDIMPAPEAPGGELLADELCIASCLELVQPHDPGLAIAGEISLPAGLSMDLLFDDVDEQGDLASLLPASGNISVSDAVLEQGLAGEAGERALEEIVAAEDWHGGNIHDSEAAALEFASSTFTDVHDEQEQLVQILLASE